MDRQTDGTAKVIKITIWEIWVLGERHVGILYTIFVNFSVNLILFHSKRLKTKPK